MAQRTVESLDRTAADGAESAASRAESASGRPTCPLCGFSTDGERGIYVHLQTSHRKSALSRLVTDEL